MALLRINITRPTLPSTRETQNSNTWRVAISVQFHFKVSLTEIFECHRLCCYLVLKRPLPIVILHQPSIDILPTFYYKLWIGDEELRMLDMSMHWCYTSIRTFPFMIQPCWISIRKRVWTVESLKDATVKSSITHTMCSHFLLTNFYYV